MFVTVKGKVSTGHGEGKRFMELAWVRKQIKEKLGFDPYPGTLNLSLPSDTQMNRSLNTFKGREITPEKGYYPGRVYKALIKDIVHGAVVRPEVPSYPNGLLEVIAPFSLREKFNLQDGDEVEVKIWLE